MINYLWKFSRHVRFSLLASCCVLLVPPGAMTAQGATYYVATTGNDANPGTLNQPFKSFKKGIGLLQPGDTLYIRGGLYTEQIDLQTPNKTGTAGNYITIGGYPGETVTVQFADKASIGYGPIKARGNRGYFIFENMILDGSASADTSRSGWAIRDGNHHFILRNLEIKNFKNVSAVIVGANDVSIQNCKLHNQRSTLKTSGTYHYGIYFANGDRGLIEGNDIYNNTGGGLQIYPGPINNLVIRNNRLHDNNYDNVKIHVGGIVVLSSQGNSITNVRIYNNIIYSNGSAPTAGSAPGIRVEASLSTTTDDVKVWNNTVYGNKGYGISINKAVRTVVQNNIVYANARSGVADYGTGTILSHNLMTDPLFNRTETFDFSLQPRSPAIDSGITLREVFTDIREMLRPHGSDYDIGAYEAITSDFTSPTPPSGLSVR